MRRIFAIVSEDFADDNGKVLKKDVIVEVVKINLDTFIFSHCKDKFNILSNGKEYIVTKKQMKLKDFWVCLI